MELTSKTIDAVTVISLQGRVDAFTAPACEIGLKERLTDGAALVLDLGGLEYISSAGLRVILAVAKVLKSTSGKLVMANVTGTVREVFEISGFGSIFTMYDSVDEAVAALP